MVWLKSRGGSRQAPKPRVSGGNHGKIIALAEEGNSLTETAAAPAAGVCCSLGRGIAGGGILKKPESGEKNTHTPQMPNTHFLVAILTHTKHTYTHTAYAKDLLSCSCIHTHTNPGGTAEYQIIPVK